MRKAKDYFFGDRELDQDQEGNETSHRLKVAITAILCEMAYIDDDFAYEEFGVIIQAIDHQFHLMDEESEELREIAEVLIKDKAKIDEFINEINACFNKTQRAKIYEMALTVAKADGKIDRFERFFANFLRQRLGLEDVETLT